VTTTFTPMVVWSLIQVLLYLEIVLSLTRKLAVRFAIIYKVYMNQQNGEKETVVTKTLKGKTSKYW